MIDRYSPNYHMPCVCCGTNVADVMGLCRKCYQREYYRRKKNIPLNVPLYYTTRKRSSPTKDKVLALYSKHEMNQSQIAAYCGISRQRVSQILNSVGVKRHEN